MARAWYDMTPQRPTGGGYVGTGDELVVVRYEGSGWDGYPAGEEAFGEPVPRPGQRSAQRWQGARAGRGREGALAWGRLRWSAE